MFKTNSRFESLNDGGNKQNQNNGRRQQTERQQPKTESKDNMFLNVKSNVLQQRVRTRMPQVNEKDIVLEEKFAKLEAERKENERLKNLSMDNFPEFIGGLPKQDSKPTLDDNSNINSFAAKLANNQSTSSNKDDNISLVGPGWTVLSFDKSTGTVKHEKIGDKTKPEPVEESNLAEKMFASLAELHERRTEEYIDAWGYDAWDTMFQFQNYDYEYFDRLDEEYEEEMAKQAEEEYNRMLENELLDMEEERYYN